MAARDHFERVSCELYKRIWALKINFVGKFNYDEKVQLNVLPNMRFSGQQESISQSSLFLLKIYASFIAMSQMQKRQARARARTRKTGLDWYH